MPEMHFEIRWPDGKTESCYSPSLVIEEYLSVGELYAVPDFVGRVRSALEIASERVRAKYGFACSSALDQLRSIEETADALPSSERAGRVTVLGFTRHAPRDARGTSKPLAPARPEHHDVIVVGGGQAGLSVSYILKQRGIEHIVLEAKQVAHSWREKRWDSFCLVTPNWQCALPGYPYAGADPNGFMLKDEIVEYVKGYARTFSLPVREGVTVESLKAHVPSPENPGRFALATSAGEMTADQVVVATGSYHVPVIPELARAFPERVLHLHSADYKNPEALPEGAVLVVGTGQSGCQIAEDLHLAGRELHLAVGPALVALVVGPVRRHLRPHGGALVAVRGPRVRLEAVAHHLHLDLGIGLQVVVPAGVAGRAAVRGDDHVVVARAAIDQGADPRLAGPPPGRREQQDRAALAPVVPLLAVGLEVAADVLVPIEL